MMILIYENPSSIPRTIHSYPTLGNHPIFLTMGDSSFCQDCKRQAYVVLDHKTKKAICSVCGLVLEWEAFIFTTANNNNNDKASGCIGNLEAAKPDFQYRKSSLVQGLTEIQRMAERLKVTRSIRSRASEIYKEMDDNDDEPKPHLEKQRKAVSAACLFIACREHKSPRTLKEMWCATDRLISMPQIIKEVENIRKRVQVGMGGSLHSGEVGKRFCFNLGLKNGLAIRAVQEAVEKSEDIDLRRNPNSVLAAIIYIITQLSHDNKSLEEISLAAGISKETLRFSYRDVYPHISRIIPKWFATEKDIKNLYNPRNGA